MCCIFFSIKSVIDFNTSVIFSSADCEADITWTGKIAFTKEGTSDYLLMFVKHLQSIALILEQFMHCCVFNWTCVLNKLHALTAG